MRLQTDPENTVYRYGPMYDRTLAAHGLFHLGDSLRRLLPVGSAVLAHLDRHTAAFKQERDAAESTFLDEIKKVTDWAESELATLGPVDVAAPEFVRSNS